MRVSADGAELHYTVLGEGPTCVVLSAVGTKPYVRMTSALADRLRLAYVDLRGGGQSTGNASDLTLEVLSADLETVRADLGVERVAVLGHSVLGILAIEYGRRCPRSVSHVVAVGTPPVWDLAKLASDGRAFFEADATEERKQVLRDNLARLPPDAGPGQGLLAQTPMRFFDPRFDAAPVFAESEYRPELLQHIIGKLVVGWDVRSDSGSLSVPLLVAHGRYDYTIPWVLWEGVAARLPNTTMRLFSRSGHQPFFEEPGEFGGAVLEWMAGSGNDAA